MAVRHCVERNCDLAELSTKELQAFSPLITEDIHAVLTLEGSVAARNHIGGAAPTQVKAAIQRLRKLLA
jgi:argininosuccinate lyase